MRRWLLASALAPALALAGCGGSSGLAQSPATGAGSTNSASANTAPRAPADVATTAHLVDPASVHQLLQSGQRVVLLFMATGCTSCAAEAHELAAATAGASQVKVVGVDMAPDDSRALTAFLDAAGVSSYPFTWTIDKDGSLAQQFNVQALSQTVGVVRGSVRFSNVSEADANQLRRQLASL